ncbi:MAG: hypothetical protein PHQ27_02685 [Victivallales bacterium]|nr:hypothetical protein [Victivallales bacterium]
MGRRQWFRQLATGMMAAITVGGTVLLADGTASGNSAAESGGKVTTASDNSAAAVKARHAKFAARYKKAAADFRVKADRLKQDEAMASIYRRLAAAYDTVAAGYEQGDLNKVKAGFDAYLRTQTEKDHLNQQREKRRIYRSGGTEAAPSSVRPRPNYQLDSRKNSDKLPELKLD